MLEAVQLWLTHSRWGPLLARAATLAVASASAAGGWKLASYLFSRNWRLRYSAPAVVALEAPDAAPELITAIESPTDTDEAPEQMLAAPVMLAAKPDCESVAASPEERDGPSPVFENEEDELEHSPEDVVDTRTAIRSVRNYPDRAQLPERANPLLLL